MELRKRTGNGKSTKHRVVEPLRVIARDNINKTTTISFSLSQYNETVFNITLTEKEVSNLVDGLKNKQTTNNKGGRDG